MAQKKNRTDKGTKTEATLAVTTRASKAAPPAAEPPKKASRERVRGPAGVLDAAWLESHPIPSGDAEGDKRSRVSVLAVGGSRSEPGELLLAAHAALRSGVGRLQLATVRSVAPHLALQVPEARVFGLGATRAGAIDADSARELAERLKGVRALHVGAGMVDNREIERFVGRLVARLDPKKGPVLVLDADAAKILQRFPDLLRRLNGRAIVVARSAELAGLLGVGRDEVRKEPLEAARQAAHEWRATVVLHGANGVVVGPDGTALRSGGDDAQTAGHALGGVIAGLVARGGDAFTAAAWGTFVHASAGAALAKEVGPFGGLERERLDRVPRALATVSRR